jgi:hypothetical protein
MNANQTKKAKRALQPVSENPTDATAASPPRRPQKIVCTTCGASPIGGFALFADGKNVDGRPRLFCTVDLPIDAARRVLSGGRLVDADVGEALGRRLGGAQ